MTSYLGHEFDHGKCTLCGALEKSVREFKGPCSGPPPKPVRTFVEPPASIVIPCVTTQIMPGAVIEEALGIVAGTAIMGANLFRDLSANIRDVIGGRVGAYESKLREGRELALEEMRAEAPRLGANAIVAVAFYYEVVGPNGSMLMIGASGTAVRLRREPPHPPEASPQF